MLIRIVKMCYHEANTHDFLQTFEERKERIASFPGCTHVELLRDRADPRIFFTYSIWDQESSLEAYRQSELFIETWGIVKQWFAEKPEAWSVSRLAVD